MAKYHTTAVQYGMIWAIELGPEDVGQEVDIDVPPGFVLKSLTNTIRTAFNGTTPTFSIVDNKGTPTTLIGSVTSGATGNTSAIAGTLFSEYPNGGKIKVRYVVASGNTTEGRALVTLEGFVPGRQNERVGS